MVREYWEAVSVNGDSTGPRRGQDGLGRGDEDEDVQEGGGEREEMAFLRCVTPLQPLSVTKLSLKKEN